MQIGEWGGGCFISSRDFAAYLLKLEQVLESMVRLAVLMLTKSAGGLDKELRSSPGPVPQQDMPTFKPGRHALWVFFLDDGMP